MVKFNKHSITYKGSCGAAGNVVGFNLLLTGLIHSRCAHILLISFNSITAYVIIQMCNIYTNIRYIQ